MVKVGRERKRGARKPVGSVRLAADVPGRRRQRDQPPRIHPAFLPWSGEGPGATREVRSTIFLSDRKLMFES